MSAFFEIEKHHRLVITSASGVVTMAEALAHNQKLRKHPDFDPSFSQLIDLSNVTKIELNREDIQRLAQDPILSDNSRRAPRLDSHAGARLFRRGNQRSEHST